MEHIKAKDAKPTIRKMLLGNGGSATVTVGDTVRVLSHYFGDRPLITLPWPLKLLQPRTFDYTVYEDNKVVEETSFDGRSINVAIAKLLEGVPSASKVIIVRDLI